MDPEVNKTTNDARAGNTPHIVRYVLAISMLLAVLVLGALVLLR
ncbi:hypothetical protein [Flavisphingopyxis soli]|nr:hypothetical protein [Sphingorhabdus soli]